MLRNRLARIAVFSTLLLSSVSAMAEDGILDMFKNWDVNNMRYELEYGIKVKESGEVSRSASGNVDGTAGASDRSFREIYTDFTVLPFEESELSITAGFSKRTYTNSFERSNNPNPKAENMETYGRFINIGNTWVVGKFILRPEFEIRSTDYKHNSRVKDTVEYRIYPKITYNLTKDMNLYTRGYFGHRELNRPGTANRDGQAFRGKQKSRMEYGTRYRFNREHALSVAYANDRTDETHRNYQIDREQIRLRYHYNPNRRITIVPHWFLPLSGTRKDQGSRAGDVEKSRIGINSNFKVTETVTLLAQVHYEWWREPKPAYVANNNNAPPKKDSMFFNLGLKHSF